MSVQQCESLSADQRKALQEIRYRFDRDSAWPNFQRMIRLLRQGGMSNAGGFLRSIPASLLIRSWHDSIAPQPIDELKLTLLGLEESGGSDDVRLFLAVVRTLADIEFRYTGEGSPTVTSEMLHSKLDFSDQYEVARLWQIIQLQNFGLTGSSGNSEAWTVTVGPDIERFQDVKSLDDYLAARRAWKAENNPWSESPVSGIASFGQPAAAVTAQPAPDPYVANEIIETIKDKAAEQTKWDCRKLIRLIEELNHNHAAGNGYAVLALLRAIVDHVPRAFGYSSFTQVVSNYAWSRTDKDHMKSLLAHKPLGDDALHRPISSDFDALGIADAPPPQWVNRLLQEFAKQL